MPDTLSATAAGTAPAVPPPIVHPMDPRRGENLSPMFAALLVWLLRLPPMTTPAITGIAVSGGIVLAATDENPLFDGYLGSLEDFEMNIRGWGEACGADAGMVENLVARVRRAGR